MEKRFLFAKSFGGRTYNSQVRRQGDNETADIDERNNSWPKKEDQNDFDKFKSNVKG